MTALTEDRNTTFSEPGVIEVPVSASTEIFFGSLVCNDSGYASPAADTSGFTLLGVALDYVDNSSGSDGDLYVRVRRDGIHKFVGAGLAQTDLNASAYAADDQTIALSGVTNDVFVGKFVLYESATAGWIDIAPAVLGVTP